MTSWEPRLDRHDEGPMYLAVVENLAEDIAAGRLAPGARLPPQRDLARQLGIHVSTITRAFNEAARRGLLDGEVGRGTFVRNPEADALPPTPVPDAEGPIDLSFNLPAGGVSDEVRRAALRELAQDQRLGDLFDHYHLAGLPRHRERITRWLEWRGIAATTEQTIVTSGAQQGVALALAGLARPGDVVLAEALTYPGVRALAEILHLRLEPIPLDRDGPDPDAFAQACRRGARVLYTMPTIHNPTGGVQTLDRRRALAAIAREHGVSILEDDSYGFLADDAPPPLCTFAPERTWFVSGFAKSLAAGLRVGVLVAPDADAAGMAARERVLAATSGMGWLVAPLMAELAVRWLGDGTFEASVASKREECRARQERAHSILPVESAPAAPTSSHLWLPLPEPWRSDDFVARARRLGVAVTPPGAFVVGRAAAPHAVRVCLATPRTRDELDRGLAILARMLDEAPGGADSLV